MLSAGADFRVCTRCVGYSRCYLLGQIFVFLHDVWAIAGFYLLFQINMFCIHSVDCSRFSIKSGLWSTCILVIKKNIIRTQGGLIACLIVFRSLVRMLFLFSVYRITGCLLQNLLADDLLVSRRRRIIRHGPALLPDVLPPGHLLVCLPPWVPH